VVGELLGSGFEERSAVKSGRLASFPKQPDIYKNKPIFKPTTEKVQIDQFCETFWFITMPISTDHDIRIPGHCWIGLRI
jgi:hypothetical protein